MIESSQEMISVGISRQLPNHRHFITSPDFRRHRYKLLVPHVETVVFIRSQGTSYWTQKITRRFTSRPHSAQALFYVEIISFKASKPFLHSALSNNAFTRNNTLYLSCLYVKCFLSSKRKSLNVCNTLCLHPYIKT